MKTFKKGGIHPPENKFSANKQIEVLDVPTQVIIPIAQHIGAPASPVVKKNDKVKVGQLIAKGHGFISANIHSSVSGTVLKIDDQIDSSGYKKKTVTIKVDGDEWEDSIIKDNAIKKEIDLNAEDIVNKVNEMGVVGLGGATFPTYVKLMVPKGKTAEVLIINGVECEPYLTSDHQLMLERGEELMIGINIVMKALAVKRTIIGIENNKPDAINHLKEIAANYPGIEVESLKVQYPQGGEKQLINALINKEVPSGGLPVETGAVVQNVGTIIAIYEAVQKNKPLFERIVTVTGKSVSKPSNLLVRIGTPIAQLIEKAGGMPDDTGKVINGGPMMGKSITTTDAMVVKGTSGILIMKEEESKRVPVQNCIRCSKCLFACPAGVEPYLLSVVSKMGNYEKAQESNIMDCIECGSCQYTCPSGRPLLDYIRVGKMKVGEIINSQR